MPSTDWLLYDSPVKVFAENLGAASESSTASKRREIPNAEPPTASALRRDNRKSIRMPGNLSTARRRLHSLRRRGDRGAFSASQQFRRLGRAGIVRDRVQLSRSFQKHLAGRVGFLWPLADLGVDLSFHNVGNRNPRVPVRD